jgi:o-succinylbenzoate synthase
MRNPFRIAHGSYAYRESVFLWLGEGPWAGMGEAPVVPYYGLSTDQIEDDLARHLSLAGCEAALAGAASGGGDFAYAPSRCAFQEAVLSLRATIAGIGLPEVLGLDGRQPAPPTTFTVAYDDDTDEMVRVAASSGFRRLKLKVGIQGDIERVAAIRVRLPDAILRVDANQGWTADEARSKLSALERLGVELVEEPIKGSLSEIERIAASTRLPILLDESARDVEQVRRCAREAPSVAGIVVKAAKNGGPAASLELARAARDMGMKVMVSSMIETSLGVGAALAIAPLCSWCDLDAPLLIADDPFIGLSYEGEVPRVGSGGIVPDPELAEYIASLEPLTGKE